MSGAAQYGDPRHYSHMEVQDIGQQLADLAKEYKYDLYNAQNIPYVKAVRYNLETGNFEVVDLLDWLQQVWDGKLLAHNPYIVRGIKRGRRRWRNHRLWLFVSDIYIAEFRFWCLKRDDQSSIYPRLDELVFRDKTDFYCGSWHQFRAYWQPFIEEIPSLKERDEVQETLEHGADTLSYSQYIPRTKPVKHRRNLWLYTRPVRSRSYVRKNMGRANNKNSRTARSVVGYVPCRWYADQNRRDPYLEIKNSPRNRRYYSTIFAKMKDWLKEGTVVHVGNRQVLGPDYMK